MSQLVLKSKKHFFNALLLASITFAPSLGLATEPAVYPPAAVPVAAAAAAKTPAAPAAAAKTLADVPVELPGAPVAGKRNKLPAEDVKSYNAAVSGLKPLNRPLQMKIKQFQKEVSALLGAPTFDKAAFKAKMLEIAAVNAKMEQNRYDVLAAYFAQLTPEKRVLVAAHALKIRSGNKKTAEEKAAIKTENKAKKEKK